MAKNRALSKADLRPDDKNANLGTTRGRKMLLQSLERYGAGRSILVDKDGHIIAGNKTFEAAKDKQVIIVPSDGKKLVVVQRTDLAIGSKEARELAIADNRVAEIDLEWNADVLKQFTDLDLSQFWTDAELRRVLGQDKDMSAPEAKLDQADELQKKWNTAVGQIWKVGAHRMMCGDCTLPENWVTMMKGKKADMAFTDPPYNVGIGGDSNPRHRQRPLLQNDSLPPEEFQAFLGGFVKNLSDWLSGDVYCVLGSREWPTMDHLMRQSGFHWSDTLIWVKDTFVLGRSKYHRRYEPIWYGWHAKGKSSFAGTKNLDDVWEIPRPRVSEEHPTMKPVELVARAVENSSAEGHTVVDPFLGSGTTMVACEKLKRSCVGFDIEPKYIAVILQRLSEMGLEPKLLRKK